MNGAIELNVKNIHHEMALSSRALSKYLFSPFDGENERGCMIHIFSRLLWVRAVTLEC